jgi:hypothetical protein
MMWSVVLTTIITLVVLVGAIFIAGMLVTLYTPGSDEDGL